MPPGFISAARPTLERLVLQPIASRIGAQIGSLDVRSKLAAAWQKLQQPVVTGSARAKIRDAVSDF